MNDSFIAIRRESLIFKKRIIFFSKNVKFVSFRFVRIIILNNFKQCIFVISSSCVKNIFRI